MLLISFIKGEQRRIGVLDQLQHEVCDLSQVAPQLPGDMLAFIAAGRPALDEARQAVASGNGRFPAASVRLLAPIPRPSRNLFCVGKNYREHVQEVQPAAAGDAIPVGGLRG